MMIAASSKPHAEQIIENSLRNDIINIFRSVIPEFAGFEREHCYEMVIGNPNLLNQCFILFRAQPQLFSEVVVDRQNQPVADDGAILKCGKELAEVIAMIVRSAAKRYFRSTLGGPIREVLPAHPQPTWKKLASGIGLVAPPPARYKVYPGPGDALFQAIRQFLRFDWQTALITEYASFSPKVAKRIGPFLGDIREPVELRAIAGKNGFAAADVQSELPLLLNNASRLLRINGAIDEDLLWSAFLQMGLGRLFPSMEETGYRQISDVVAKTNKYTVSLLMKALDDNLRLSVCFLFVAYATLGEEEYLRSIAGDEANTTFVEQLVQRIFFSKPFPPCSLAKMRSFSLKVLN